MSTRLQTIGPNGCLESFRRWRNGAGPLQAYVSPTMHRSLNWLIRMGTDLTLPDTAAVPSLAHDVPSLGSHQLLVLEAPAAIGLKTAMQLAAERGLWPILTSRLQFHQHGLFGDPETAALLLLQSPQVAVHQGWCLLLDMDRTPSGPIDVGVYDNRHDFKPGDLPSGQDLDAIGVREVHFVIRHGNHPDKELPEDLLGWVAILARQRISVCFR